MYKEGLLLKRARGLRSSRIKWQERFCKLTSTSLDYYDPKKMVRRVALNNWCGVSSACKKCCRGGKCTVQHGMAGEMASLLGDSFGPQYARVYM